MNRHYGGLEHVSLDVQEKIKRIEVFFDSRNIEYDLYCGYPIINEDFKKEFVKGFFITKHKLLVLYENEQEKAKFSSSLLNHLTVDSSLIKISLEFPKYVSTINLESMDIDELSKEISSENLLSIEDLKKINRAIQKSFNLTRTDDREISNTNSLGAVIKKRNTYISNYDENQFNMVLKPVTKHQRVRGLAGSGKTILLLKKLAYLHYIDRKLKICFVFYTTSLRYSMVTLFKEFYKEYDAYREPDFNYVKIFHAWGGKGSRGFYSDLCELTSKEYMNYNDAKNSGEEGEPFEIVSKKLLSDLKNDSSYIGTYDYVFVDEAQDFGINFFHLALKSLRQNGKLIYAYDELQSLKDEVSIPSKKMIFGNELECEDINLGISYRAPLEILTTAHAIGLGIYRSVSDGESPIVNFVDENTLIDMGYENLTGEFIANHLVDLRRKYEHGSDILVDKPKTFSKAGEQYYELTNEIIDLLENQDVIPEDIMIIDLNNSQLIKNYEQFSNSFEAVLAQRELNKDFYVRLVSSKTPSMKKEKNAITYTSVFRAKGNEANLVFVINCNRVLLNNNRSYRNEIFTAMTRAKVKVWLYGTSVDFLTNEIEKVKDEKYHLKFIYPTEQQKENIRLLGDKEEQIEEKVQVAEGLSIEILEAILAQKKLESRDDE